MVYITVFEEFKSLHLFDRLPKETRIDISGHASGEVGEKNIKIFYEVDNKDERHIAEFLVSLLLESGCILITDGFQAKYQS